MEQILDFTADEEGELCRHILRVSHMGLWKTQHDVMCLVETHVKNKSLLNNDTISNGWLEKN